MRRITASDHAPCSANLRERPCGKERPAKPERQDRSRQVRALLLGVVLLLAPAARAAEPCSDCHEKTGIGAGSRSVHPPFDEDDCTACHADHGDEERLMLRAAGPALCAECHDYEDAGFLQAHDNVQGDKVPCTSCHDPHRSTVEHLLLPNRHRPLAFGRCDPCHRFDGKLHKPLRDLCLGCHDGEEFSRKVAHAPVRNGQCLSCHDPHASRRPSLLKAVYAPGRSLTGEGDVALCLGCHDRRNFFSETTENTLFRSAERNLHARHVGRATPDRRALSCRNCHEVHSSDAPRLVRRELDCGGVPCLKLDYRRTDSGGQCQSGCHAPQDYSSETFTAPAVLAPVLAPAAAPAPGRATATLPEPSALERSINKGCLRCHEKAVQRFAKGRLHAPVLAGSCSFCHLDHGPENRLILLDRADRLCARCHDLGAQELRATHGGYALEGSICTECHNPHGGNSAGFVYERRHSPFEEGDCGACHGEPDTGWKIAGNTMEICRQCHDEIGGEKHPHSALAAGGCLGCHRAHAAAEPALLRATRPALCFICHPRQKFVGETTHDPVGEGDCAACHPAHGSANGRLLARAYPIGQYASFSPGSYALCLDCHDEEGLTDPERAEATGFAHGERNLHALHLRDRAVKSAAGTRVQPGVTCRNCHDPHATANPRLIRKKLDCDGVPCLQLEFRKVGEGGKCFGGCHIPQSYLPK